MAPLDPKLRYCLAANLREHGKLARASEVIDQALRDFPDDPVVASEAARIAMARGMFARALLFWDMAVASPVAHPDWLCNRVDTLIRLARFVEARASLAATRRTAPDHGGLAELERRLARVYIMTAAAASAPAQPNVPSAERFIDPRDLVMEFESLGRHCEFGLVQRYCGAEPLGLFRFSTSHTPNLQDAIATRFTNYGQPGDLHFESKVPQGEIRCSSRHYNDFEYHTHKYVGTSDLEEVQAREYRKVFFLKRRLLADLGSGEKIFVRVRDWDEPVADLFAALRQIGPNTLLWVTVADANHASGFVEQLQPGLLKGYIAHYAALPDIDLSGWLEVCCKAYAMTCGARHRPPLPPLPTQRCLDLAGTWVAAEGCAVEVGTVAGEPTLHFTLDQDIAGPLATYVSPRRATPGVLIAFSVWIMIPLAWRTGGMHLRLRGAGGLERRDIWQRLWITAEIADDVDVVAIDLYVVGSQGDEITIAKGQLDSGYSANANVWDAVAQTRVGSTYDAIQPDRD